jgi:hypothetical protein
MAGIPEPTTHWTSVERASWALAIIGAVASLITLLSVFVLVGQLSASRKSIEQAKRADVVGGFYRLVASEDGLGIQSTAVVPAVSVPDLVKADVEMSPSRLALPWKRPCQSGWANFLSPRVWPPLLSTEGWAFACGFHGIFHRADHASHPATSPYEMEWERFVNMCALLGFQQNEDVGAGFSRTVFSLPAYWYGPVGCLIPRETPSGIVATFRPTTQKRHIISDNIRIQGETPTIKINLRRRAYMMAGCLLVDDDKALLFDGVDGCIMQRLWAANQESVVLTTPLGIFDGGSRFIASMGSGLFDDHVPHPHRHSGE